LFGPNAAGKSNLLEAVQALSRIGTTATLSDALAEPIRGYPVELFTFSSGGLGELLDQSSARFSLEAEVQVPGKAAKLDYQYRIEVEIHPRTGKLVVANEHLAYTAGRRKPVGFPLISRKSSTFQVRKTSKAAQVQSLEASNQSAALSLPRFGPNNYPGIARCRQELNNWRIYYLDPRVAMRSAQPPAQVSDIGVLGEDIAPFLHRLAYEEPSRFSAVKRTLRALVPSVEDLGIDLDKRRGTLDIQVRQFGTLYSSRIISEGTLRVLALCAVAANPWTGSLLAFEEPENGVHPRRLELIAQLLVSLALGQGRQIIVTTHSPLFCDAVLKEARRHPQEIALINTRHSREGTTVRPLEAEKIALAGSEIAESLTAPTEDGLFENLILRGLLDD
jgi:predicted ATPase